MKNLYTVQNATRVELFGNLGDDEVGAFNMRSCRTGEQMNVIAASGMGWDHVSVTCRARCPTWEEMEQVKHEFFEPGETAMQLHVPPVDHINQHPYCLHLWRPHGDVGQIPRPPAELVGHA